MLLSRKFFRRDPLTCARDLIGCRLQWGELSGMVTETEAYDAEDDESCHTFFRPSARAFVASHQPGAAYVYFNYGVHWMLNVLVKGRREGFVLIRALEPIAGIEAMSEARGGASLWNLCSGPGKLTQAIGVTGADHGRDLCADPRFAFHRRGGRPEILDSRRIGISRSVDLPWRFYAAGTRHVSAHPRDAKRPAEAHFGRPGKRKN